MITCTDDAVLQRNIKFKDTTRELDLTKERFQKKIAEITTYYETLILQKENEHQNECEELKEVINTKNAQIESIKSQNVTGNICVLINPTKTRNKFCIKKKTKSKGTFKKEETSINCAVTNCQGNDDCDLVACDKCDKWVCGTCYDINISKLKLVMEKCSSIYFLCKDCEIVLPPSPCNDTTSLNV